MSSENMSHVAFKAVGRKAQPKASTHLGALTYFLVHISRCQTYCIFPQVIFLDVLTYFVAAFVLTHLQEQCTVVLSATESVS